MILYSATSKGFYDTAIHGDNVPQDAKEIAGADYVGLLNAQAAGKIIQPAANGYPIAVDPPAPTQEELIAACTDKVQGHLDVTVQAQGYDNMISAVSYCTSAHPKFGPEGIAARDWRDDVWTYCNQVKADCQSAVRAIPTPDELIAELPPIVWPV